MVRRAQAALRSVEHTSVRQLRVLAAIVFLFAMVIATVALQSRLRWPSPTAAPARQFIKLVQR